MHTRSARFLFAAFCAGALVANVADCTEATARVGQDVTFSVRVDGSPPFVYQWRREDAPIPGATDAIFSISGVTRADAARYSVLVSNPAGSLISDLVTLVVEETGAVPGIFASTDAGPVPTSRLINLSSRTQVGTAAAVTISGFVVKGPEPQRLLIRGIGPSLESLGVEGPLMAPVLTVFAGSTAIASNQGWQSDDEAVVRAVSAGVGAFALPEGGRDCAIVRTFPPGAYTAQLTGQNGESGIGLIEVYAADSGSRSRLVNASTRAFAGLDAQLVITGFVVKGPSTMTLLVRAVGPGLSELGVQGALHRPSISLYSAGGGPIATNAGWTTAGSPADIASAAARVGAFALAPHSADSALLITLSPGAYTLHAGGIDGETGIVLVEVYEIAATQ